MSRTAQHAVSHPLVKEGTEVLVIQGLEETLFSSTGQRNTLVEYFCWGTEGQRLSRPLAMWPWTEAE